MLLAKPLKKIIKLHLPILEVKSKNDDSLVANKNIKTYTLGSKVSKKMNMGGD